MATWSGEVANQNADACEQVQVISVLGVAALRPVDSRRFGGELAALKAH